MYTSMVYNLSRLCVPKAIPLPKEVVQQSTRLLSQSPFSLFQSSPPLLNQQLLWAPVHDLWIVKQGKWAVASEKNYKSPRKQLGRTDNWPKKNLKNQQNPKMTLPNKIEPNNAACPQEIVQIGRRRNNRGARDLRLDSGAHPGSPPQLCWGLEWHRPVTTQDHPGRRGELARCQSYPGNVNYK